MQGKEEEETAAAAVASVTVDLTILVFVCGAMYNSVKELIEKKERK